MIEKRIPVLEEFVKQYLLENNIPLKYKEKNTVDLIIYGYRKSEKWTCDSSSVFYKEYFPNRKPRAKVLNYIYINTSKKYCRKCEEVKDLVNGFYTNKNNSDGRQANCKSCSLENKRLSEEKNKDHYKRLDLARTNKRNASKLKRTPSWTDINKIQDIYYNCPEGYHVDHIIPLQGELVSGLHVPENLQYLPASENLSKGNRYIIE